MNTVLWVLQIGLAVVFALAGTVKIALPREQLSTRMGDWVDPVPAPAIKLLGLAELAAAVGLVAPPLAGIAPVLTPLAAIGVVIVLAGAIVLHSRRHEYPNIAVNVALAVAAGVVVWGRFGPYAF